MMTSPQFARHRRRTRRLAAAIVLCGACLFALLLLEVGARLLFRAPVDPNPAIMPHPKYIYTLRPDSEANETLRYLDGVERTVTYAVSSQGLRDRDYGAKGRNEKRILFLGDSFTFGDGLSHDETLPKTLERLIAETHPCCRISVVNAGVPGYAPWQERGFLDERGMPRKPDLVILQLFPSNDVTGSLERTGEFLEAYHRAWADTLLRFRYQNLWPVRVETWLRRHLRIVNVMVTAAETEGFLVRLHNALGIGEPFSVPDLPPSADRPFWAESTLRDPYPVLARGWRLFEEDVQSIRDFCDSRNLPMIAFAIPEMNSLFDARWQKTTDADIHARWKDVHQGEAILQELNIASVSLLDTFYRYPAKERLYIESNAHLSHVGTEVVAEILLKRLKVDAAWLFATETD